MTIRFRFWRLTAAMMLAVLSLGLAAGGVLAGAATPTPDPHHPVQTTPTAPGGPCNSSVASTPTSQGMMNGSSGAMHEDFDLMFIDMMIPHHQAAIAMAQIALVRGEHPGIRVLAQQIIQSQGTEVTLMKAWRDEWYPGAAALPMDQMVATMSGLMGKSASGMMGDGMGMSVTMDPMAETQALCSATGSFDEAFIQLMIPHHESAVAMAQVALQRSTHPDLAAMAKGLVYSQGQEIDQMKAWLSNWYGATPTAS